MQKLLERRLLYSGEFVVGVEKEVLMARAAVLDAKTKLQRVNRSSNMADNRS
jgi:hypothetical protein